MRRDADEGEDQAGQHAQAEQMKPEYLRMNPKHKVPVLLIDGKPLTENVALWMTRAFALR